ncbi:A/G-specific adenine glycosylase [Ruicaihuangia caeni]|uniref:Adenine DNA glycosylase n=1 Tax=Ruicaihuangia caeni TaxID=3042517 RepID=A0AAW6T7Z5_9MICO|nr:A/G-specific adenine glycosylase [Klugiella sp. YN-L-19]MDI2097515.1 A/G-specific adenine glycosylase [Klugiella sp. YN-L-19]
MRAAAIADAVIAWFGEYARELPWREQGFPAWGILVSEVMLQQTQVARVVPRLAEWLDRWPTPAALAAEPPGEAVRMWHRLGYPRRALNLHAAAVVITERHGGEVPSDVEQLLALPGVGDYTARAVASFAFGERHPVVDTNVRRVIARAVAGLAEAGPPRIRADLEAMERLLPTDRRQAQLTNAGVMELGAIVCTARAPRCDGCPINALCAWRAAGYPAYDGPRARGQARFEGSDRQVRGLVMAELRASDIPVTRTELERAWPDAEQLTRAIDTLVRDGLAVSEGDAYRLP